jgi:type VI protein secretion system component Hcp
MNKFQTVLNRTFKHEKYGKYVVLRKSKNKTIHGSDLYVIKFLNSGNEKEYIKTKIINKSVSDTPTKTNPKENLIGEKIKTIIDVIILEYDKKH